jgi:pilus assembly protein CpaB
MNVRFLALLSVSLIACSEARVVLMAAGQELPEGAELERSHLVEVKVSSVLATPNAVKPEQVQALIGKRLRIPLQKGDLVLSSYFEQNAAVSNLVAKRARAVTLSVSGAENLHLGDHVDLLAMVMDPNTNEWVTITQTQNVIVLSPGSFEPKKDDPFPLRRVTFLMISEEAESALLAVKVGGLHVSLRNEDDVDVMEERGRATINTLLSSERRLVLENRRKNTLVQAPPSQSPNVAPVPTMPGTQE